MSTRSSIVYVCGLHIYREMMSGEICLTVETDWNNLERKRNAKYEDPVISKQELAEIRDKITDFLGDKNCIHPGCGCVCGHQKLCPEDGPSIVQIPKGE